uniref:G_PROTEIN_RECEP_F1_2 domain-containing protein n=1 Tax=Steinernema glaseri TaxID=37863 RepID=A0A1I7ZRB6_9BILA
MDIYLFDHEKYKYFYNCSMYTTEQWNSFGVRRPGLGIFSIIVGTLAIILYVPCAKTMLLPELWKLPCYRLMFLNSIIDILGLINSCIVSGYLSIEGVVYCSYPDFLYIYGSFTMGLWAAQCMTALILGINRCIEFWQYRLLSGLFKGYKMAFWWMVVIAYFFLFFMFTGSSPYNTIMNMWMTDPYAGIPGIKVDRSWYANLKLLNINNTGVFVGLSSCYIFLVFSIWLRRRMTGSVTLSKIQRQVSIQACVICSFICLAGGIYVFFELFPEIAGPTLIIIDFLSWQCGFYGVIICYMVMNTTLRRGVIGFYLQLLGYLPHPNMTASIVTGAVVCTT